jgi:nucleoid-associated protein YgaU
MFRHLKILPLTLAALLTGCGTLVRIPDHLAASTTPRHIPSASVRTPLSPAVQEHDLLLARNALPRLYTYTNLSDAQLQRVHDIEHAIARRQGALAWQMASALEQQLKTSVRHHRVARGESLWTIAGREDVYNNSWLWPLIWDANRDSLRNPAFLRAGQELKIRPNPTIGEVLRAVHEAHQHVGSRIHIGQVHEIKP